MADENLELLIEMIGVKKIVRQQQLLKKGLIDLAGAQQNLGVVSGKMAGIFDKIAGPKHLGKFKTFNNLLEESGKKMAQMGKNTKKAGGATKNMIGGWLSLMFAGMALQRVMGGFFKSAIESYKMLDKKGNTPLKRALTKLSATWTFLKFAMLDAISPFLIELIKWLADILMNIAETPGMAKALAWFVGIAALAGGFMMFVGQFGSFVTGMKTLSGLNIGKGVTGLLDKLGGGKGFTLKGLGKLTLGFAAVAIGVGGVVGGIEKIMQGDVMEGIIQTIGGALAVIGGILLFIPGVGWAVSAILISLGFLIMGAVKIKEALDSKKAKEAALAMKETLQKQVNDSFVSGEPLLIDNLSKSIDAAIVEQFGKISADDAMKLQLGEMSLDDVKLTKQGRLMKEGIAELKSQYTDELGNFFTEADANAFATELMNTFGVAMRQNTGEALSGEGLSFASLVRPEDIDGVEELKTKAMELAEVATPESIEALQAMYDNGTIALLSQQITEEGGLVPAFETLQSGINLAKGELELFKESWDEWHPETKYAVLNVTKNEVDAGSSGYIGGSGNVGSEG